MVKIKNLFGGGKKESSSSSTAIPSAVAEETTPLNGTPSYGAVPEFVPDEATKKQQQQDRLYAVDMKNSTDSFFHDLMTFREGSLPQSMIIACSIGVFCGIAAWLYYTCLFTLLDVLWHDLPNKYVVGVWPEWAYVLWIPLLGYIMAICVGLSVKYLGDPGDLAYVVKCVHEKAYISTDHTLPVIVASQFSILGGGSLGPEAPLVAICASISGYISRSLFRTTNRNIVRKHTMMGMAGALAAFFGAPLGGSLFALEVTSRLGMEYFEHAIESIFCGEITLAVFRALSGLSIGPIWDFSEDSRLPAAQPHHVLLGIGIGILGGGLAMVFAKYHEYVMSIFQYFDLLHDRTAVQRALLGGTVIILLGMLVPQSMFWGEYEIDTLAALKPSNTLTHVWPNTGLLGFEMDSLVTSLVTGFCKLMAISWTVAGGYRGGYIFPLFAAGCAFGRAFLFIVPAVPVQLATLCFAAALNVSITRTALATPVILCYLSGEQNALAGVLASSLTALFVTSYMPFIKPQVPRADLDQSLWWTADAPTVDTPEPAQESAPVV